jgi:ADP-sugar diphosphatase
MLEASLNEPNLFQSPLFTTWAKKVESHGNVIKNVEIKSIITRGTNRIYSAFIDVELLTPEGQKLNRCILLRGPSVAVIPVLLFEDQEYILLTKQRRIIDGDYSFEVPAGAHDPSTGTPRENAALELEEETGLKVNPNDLIQINKTPLKVCESLLDETVHFFGYVKSCSLEELEELKTRSSGVHSDQEYIALALVPIAELSAHTSFQINTSRLFIETVLRPLFDQYRL